jgi:hypothetical protein
MKIISIYLLEWWLKLSMKSDFLWFGKFLKVKIYFLLWKHRLFKNFPLYGKKIKAKAINPDKYNVYFNSSKNSKKICYIIYNII